MLTYQLQDRVFIFENDKSPEFPNKAIIQLTFGPLEAFGCSDNPSRLAIAGQNNRLLFNPNTGRTLFRTEPPLEKLNVTYEGPTGLYRLIGNILQFETELTVKTELDERLTDLLYIYPSLLNMYVANPPVILGISGRIGEVTFQMQYRKAINYTQQIFLNEITDDIRKSMLQLHEIKNLRLSTALYYFHLACRLAVAGHTPYEFLAEIILQFCKILQVLFGNDYDHVRAGLAQLGYASSEIERDFIPLMVLRNNFDIAHARIAIPDQQQLQILYEYLMRSEIIFRDLLNRILRELNTAQSIWSNEDQIELSAKDQQKFDKLIEIIRPAVED